MSKRIIPASILLAILVAITLVACLTRTHGRLTGIFMVPIGARSISVYYDARAKHVACVVYRRGGMDRMPFAVAIGRTVQIQIEE